MYVPRAPRQAAHPPTRPSNSVENLALDPLAFNNNEFFNFSDFPYDPFPLNNDPFESSPFHDNYTFDLLPGQGTTEPALQNPTRMDPTEAGYHPHLHLSEEDAAPSLAEGPYQTAPAHPAPIVGSEQFHQRLDPNSCTKFQRKERTEECTAEDSSNSPESTDSLESNSSRDSQKRKFEIMTFPSIPDNQVAEPKRKKFDPKSRKKVALVRKFKPCKRCGFHKIGVH